MLDKRLVCRMLWLLLRAVESMLLANYVPDPAAVPQLQREAGQRAINLAAQARTCLERLMRQANVPGDSIDH